MSISFTSCGAVILAGGQSRRMGQCKAMLDLGGMTLLDRLAAQLADFDELMISANNEAIEKLGRGRVVRDIFPGLGPLAGLHAALSHTEKAYVFCIPCDMPCFTSELAAAMLDAFPRDGLAMVCEDGTGRIHPLCGIYSKKLLSVMERRLCQEQLRMMEFLKEAQAAYFQTAGRFPDTTFLNVNTPEDFSQALHLLKRE